jgi:hypothetical protein
MFADPVTVTINAVAKSLVKINQDKYGSEYLLRETTGEIRLKIRNSTYTSSDANKALIDRHNLELTQVIYATSTVPSITRKIYTVFENYRSDTVVDPVNFGLGLVGFMTNGNLTKLVNYES